MKKLLAIVICAAGLAAAAAPVTARGTGRNADYRSAVYDALAQAMSQVEGLSLQESRQSLMSALEQSIRSDSNVDVSEVKEAMQQSIAAKTQGRILGYTVISEQYEEASGTWHVEVEAKMPGRYIVGRDPDNLRRMVVMPFRPLTESVTIAGQQIRCGKANEELADKLNTSLTHTRKFTMLDRTFTSDILSELSRLNMDNASAGDIGRFNQMLVTDYMVTGTVKMYPQQVAVSNPYTGSASVPDSTCMEISYRVLLVPTSQLKWADTIKVPYSVCAGASAEEIAASAAEWAAEEICEQIIANIYPLRVTGHTTYELILNQGGKNVQVGDEFDVFRRGEAIVDVTTGESLGYAEEMIARIRISRVTPKVSYALVFEGTPAEDIEDGAVVRRSTFTGGAPAPSANSAAPIQIAPGGGVRPAWLN